VDPDPDPLLLRKSGRAGNPTRAYESVARNSDHWTTGKVVSPTHRPHFTPQKQDLFLCFQYSFLLEAE
jgi:hypothetical protein